MNKALDEQTKLLCLRDLGPEIFGSRKHTVKTYHGFIASLINFCRKILLSIPQNPTNKHVDFR